MDLEIKTVTQGEIGVIAIRGEIDLHTAPHLRETLVHLIDEDHCRAIIVNLEHMPYLDGAALGVMVDAVRRIRERDGLIVLVATTPFVRRAFEITRLVKIFELADTVDDALSLARQRLSSVEVVSEA